MANAASSWPEVDLTPESERLKTEEGFSEFWEIKQDFFLLYYLNKRYTETDSPALDDNDREWARIVVWKEPDFTNGEEHCLAYFGPATSSGGGQGNEGEEDEEEESWARYRKPSGNSPWYIAPTGDIEPLDGWKRSKLHIHCTHPSENLFAVTRRKSKRIRLIKLFTTYTAFRFLHDLYLQRADLLPVRELPNNVKIWAEINIRALKSMINVHEQRFLEVSSGYEYQQNDEEESDEEESDEEESDEEESDEEESDEEESDEEQWIEEEEERARRTQEIIVHGHFAQGYANHTGDLETTFRTDFLPGDLYSAGEDVMYTLFYTEDRCYLFDVTKQAYFLIHFDPIGLADHCTAYLKFWYQTPDTSRWVWAHSGHANEDAQEISYFVCLGADRVITDRVVVKHLKRHESDRQNEDDEFSLIPRELFLHKIISQLPEQATFRKDCFIRYRHYSEHHSSDKPHCLYMEMADKGNLREMQTQLNELRENYPSTPAHLPELFIWMVFRNITWACDTLRSEYREEENVFVHADTVNDIVHAEIKPANILIKRKDPPEISETLKKQMKSRGQRQNQFPFGVPVLGDLEKYYRLWSNLSSERLVATSGAPGGFSAPEEAGPFPHTPVAIDVFQIGATIWSLMRNEPYGLRDVGGGILQQGQMIPYRNMDEMLARHDNDLKYDRLYSQRLENLVSSCLKEDLRKRIEIDDLSLAVEHGYWAVVRHNAGLLETPESELPDYMRIPFYMSANGAFALGRTLGPEAERSEVVRVSSRVGQDEEDAVDLYLDGDGDDMPWGRY